jgi:hypothetical protein
MGLDSWLWQRLLSATRALCLLLGLSFYRPEFKTR